MSNCPKCNASLKEGQNFCTKCGTKVLLTRQKGTTHKLMVGCSIAGILLAVAAIMVFWGTPTVTFEGTLRSVPPNISLKGLKVKGTVVGSNSTYESTTDSTGKFQLKRLPLNGRFRIFVEEPNYLSDSVEIMTGTEPKSITLPRPLGVVRKGPSGVDAWVIIDNQTIPLIPVEFKYWAFLCNGGVAQTSEGRLTIHYAEFPADWNIPKISKASWIVVNRSALGLIYIDYQGNRITEPLGQAGLGMLTYRERYEIDELTRQCSGSANCHIVVPNGWYSGIETISFGPYDKGFCYTPISIKENFRKLESRYPEIPGYQIIRGADLPSGRWVIIRENILGRARNFYPMARESKSIGWAFEVRD